MEDTEDYEFVSAEHDRLVNAISKLDKTQHIIAPTRNEPTNLNSEFNLIKSSKKLDLNSVVTVLEDTAHHVEVSKKIKKSQDQSNILPKPLEKPQAERIKRSTGYDVTKEKVCRWDPVVARSRSIDFVSFPLKHVSTKLEPTQEFLSKFKLKSPLEKELEEVDPQIMEENDKEEEPEFVSYHEMLEQRMKIAKLRAQESYRAAKAKRQGKIKSKKYHRLLKKERLQKQLKEFEELQKRNPEEALAKLEALEKARALERHTLRHKNTGKWAKSKLIRAKYDKDVREQLAEQLAVSRNLTKKLENNDSESNIDDDTDDDAKEGNIEVPFSQNTCNNWFTRKESILNKEDDSGDNSTDDEMKYKIETNESDKIVDVSKMLEFNNNKLSSDKHYTNSETISVTRHTAEKVQKKVGFNVDENIKNTTTSVVNKKSMLRRVSKPQSKKVVATTNWTIEVIDGDVNDKYAETKELVSSLFDSYEKKIAGKVKHMVNKLRSNIKRLDKKKESSKDTNSVVEIKENLEYLKLKNQKQKPIIDEELIETGTRNIEDPQNIDKSVPKLLTTPETTDHIDTVNVSTIKVNRNIKPKQLYSALPIEDYNLDLLDEDDQVVPKATFHEVLENDDDVDSFRQEKEDEIKKDLPENLDSTLPGWGSWTGKGVKAPKRKRNRFIVKNPPKILRRDENKGDVIIKEFKNPKLAVHKITEIPFPFSSVKEFEASIRTPLGNTFIPEKVHKKLIKPSVFTKIGTIIEPMDEEELLASKNKTFKISNDRKKK